MMNDVDKIIAKKYTIDQFVGKTGMESSNNEIDSLIIERDNALLTMDIISDETLSYINDNTPGATSTISTCTVTTSGGKKRLLMTGNKLSLFANIGMLIHLKRSYEVGDDTLSENLEVYLSEAASNDILGNTRIYIKPANSSYVIVDGTENYTISFYNNAYINQRENEYLHICDGLIHKVIWDSQVYGIMERIENLNSKSNICEKIHDHATDSIASYMRFSDWGNGIETGVTPDIKTPLFDNNISFISDNVFKVDYDKTEDLHLNREILIDCGEDGFKSGEINSSIYYPPSAGNYTEVHVVPDFANYSFLNENIIEMKINDEVVYPIPSYNLFTNTNWLSAGNEVPPVGWDVIGNIDNFNVDTGTLSFTSSVDNGISQNVPVVEGELMSLSIDYSNKIRIKVYDIENENYILDIESPNNEIEFIIPHACENIRVEFLLVESSINISNPNILYKEVLNINEDRTTFWFYGDKTDKYKTDDDIIITFNDGIVKKGLIRESFYYDEQYEESMYTYVRLVRYYNIINDITSINVAISAGSTVLEPLSGGISYIDEMSFKIEDDQTSLLVEGKEGIWLTVNNEYSMPFKVTSSEYKTDISDYTLVSYKGNENTSGLPITENIQKIYVLPEP